MSIDPSAAAQDARAANPTTARGNQLGWWKSLVFALIPVLLLIVGAELVIRVTGAARTCPSYVQSPMWICDPILHFRMRPDLVLNGRPMNAMGFRDGLLDPTAAYRVITLGDSCTFGLTASEQTAQYLDAPYPRRLQELADARDGPGQLSVLNAGACGYNTYQGIMLLRTKLRRLPADLITVRYGWNDLLTSAERVSPNAFHEPSSPLGIFVEDVLLRTAIYPYGRKLAIALHDRSRANAAAFKSGPLLPTQWTPNIPLPEFDHNLRRIVELGHGRGAAVWLLTAPDAFTIDAFRGREDAYAKTATHQGALNRIGGIGSFRELKEIHARYNAVIRRVAAEMDVPLVDMEDAYRRHASQPLFGDADAIHPTEEGHAVEAEELYLRLVTDGVLGRSPSSVAP